MPGEQSIENGKLGGRPLGRKNDATLEKEKVDLAIKQRIFKNADLILNSQLSIGKGQQFLYKIEKTQVVGSKGGISYKSEKPKLVTEEWEIQAYLDGLVDEDNGESEPKDRSATYYFITTKEPNNMAIDSMFNRALGKATEHTDITTGGKSLNALLVKFVNGDDNRNTTGVQEPIPK